MKGSLAYLAWGLLFAASLACFGVFLHAAWTYHGLGDARVAVDLTSPGEWRSAPFRLTGENHYTVHLEATNHYPPFGTPWQGSLELRISRPGGDTWFQEHYGPGHGDFHRPENLSSERLVRFKASGTPWKAWHVNARVLDGDPEFAGVHAEVHLRREHADYGLFAVTLFMMVIPAALLWAVSIFPAMRIAHGGGSRIPIVISVTLTAAAFLVMLSTLIGVPLSG